jgi:AcrR family transcriptional regulator
LHLLQSIGYRADVHEDGIGGLRERKKQKTRELIADIALRLFAERGYGATTVAEIAEAAEISERTVFTYFSAKEDLLFSDHADFELGLGSALARRPKGMPALEALRNFMVESLSRFDAQARLRWQIVSHDEHLRNRERARQAELGSVIATAIADELGEEEDDLRPQLVTAAVIAAFTATYEHRFSARSKTASRAQAVAVIDEAIAFLSGGLEAIRAYPKPY